MTKKFYCMCRICETSLQIYSIDMVQKTSQRIQTIPWNIKPSQQAVLVGQNGSGKSHLAKFLLKPWPNVFCIDPKAEFEYDSDYGKPRIITDPARLSKIRPDDPTPIYYRPEPKFWNVEIYNAVYKWVYERRNCTVYTDEIFAVMGSTNNPPPWFNAVLTRGRSLNIRSIACTQRPFRVPITLLSEAKHYFMFTLKMRDDIKRMVELMDENVSKPITVEYAFYYYDATKPRVASKLYKLGGK